MGGGVGFGNADDEILEGESEVERAHPATTPRPQTVHGGGRPVGPVMDADWGGAYAASATWGADWSLVNDPGPDWPQGIKVFGDKMYKNEKLCVPEDFVSPVVREHHDATGHAVGKRLMAELLRRYVFPPNADVRAVVDQIHRQCLVCQAC